MSATTKILSQTLPCPFCGTDGKCFVRDETRGDMLETAYLIECKQCKTRGPISTSRAGAATMWNERARPDGTAQDEPTAVRSSDLLEVAVANYEGMSGFDAINYRQLPKNASMQRRVEAAWKDAHWFEGHSQDAHGKFTKAIGDYELDKDL